jgi:hypothetical protein
MLSSRLGFKNVWERVQLESREEVKLLCRWLLGSRAGWQRGWLESGEGGIGLGFGAVWETVRVENGYGGGDGDSLHFYVAITLPQMPLSEIEGVVNLFSAWRAKERHLIFGACWRDYTAWCEIKFSGCVGGTARCGAQQRLEFIPCFNRKWLRQNVTYLISIFSFFLLCTYLYIRWVSCCLFGFFIII